MIPLPYPPKLVQKTGNTGIFEIEALYPGYGATVGNALRRVLLSSIEGAAITWIRIKGVPHEFSTILHVYEDVIQIILNLKKMRFILHGDEPQHITLHVKGECEVKGNDFALPSQVELVTKDIHIATLTNKNAELEMEAQIERGLGYQAAEAGGKEKGEIGTIRLDALFSPVVRVSFRVEHMRVQERTDYDRLFVEIETDGTVTPEYAMFHASNVLRSIFGLISQTFAMEAEKKVEGAQEEDLVKKKIEELDLSTRIINVLHKNKIKKLGGLLRKSQQSILELEGMGEAGLQELNEALKKLGLQLKE